ncbi:MAG TPA: alpha/beta fold hydrolase [Holophagaceae bacterium]
MESRSTTVEGVRMRWEEQGEGLPVVLIHGIPTNPGLWRHVVPLVRYARCLAWEMVGYGLSIPQGRGRDISVARQAEYLAAWLTALGIEKAVLVGHDLGGGVAQVLAVRHRERVAGLVLVNAVCYDSWPIPRVRLMRALGGLVEKLPNPLLWPAFAQLILQGHDQWRRGWESLPVHWGPYARGDAAEALVRQIRALDPEDTLAVAGRLPELRLPARLVWGAADEFQKIEYGDRLAGDLAAPADVVPGARHFVPEDHPERVAAVIEELLRELRSGQTAAGAA